MAKRPLSSKETKAYTAAVASTPDSDFEDYSTCHSIMRP